MKNMVKKRGFSKPGLNIHFGPPTSQIINIQSLRIYDI
jgi:hypothetical protein